MVKEVKRRLVAWLKTKSQIFMIRMANVTEFFHPVFSQVETDAKLYTGQESIIE